MFSRWRNPTSEMQEIDGVRPLRTRSLRERFASKRSYSENLKEPPAPPTSPGPRTVRPSLPIIGVQQTEEKYVPKENPLQPGNQRSTTTMPDGSIPYSCCFVALPEETYCSALDINSSAEGDPRFPWQRDAAVQCDFSPTGEGCRYARKNSFFMLAKEELQTHTEEVQEQPSANQSFTMEKFKEAYWHNLSICKEEDEPAESSTSRENARRKKKSSVLQRAMSERIRSRRLVHQYSTDNKLVALEPQTSPGEMKVKAPQPPVITVVSAPGSRTDTPPEIPSPQRRNSERRRKAFVRKNTQSAPDSFENDDEEAAMKPRNSAPHVANVGYFDFDSMQRLLDLSMAVKPEKPSLLLTPGGLTVGKDKSGTYMTLPSPNVHTADGQEDGVLKRLAEGVEDDESEMEDTEPPASALHRRRALVPPKMMSDDYESTTDDGDPTSPSGDGNNSTEESSKGGQDQNRRSSVVVIPPSMQICPGDLLVYSKVLSQRNALLDYDGSTQSLSLTEDTARKGKNTWSLLRLFERSGRGKSEGSSGSLEELLSSLRPSDFSDEHLAKYKGMLWSEFVLLVESRANSRTPTRRNSRKNSRASSDSSRPSPADHEHDALVSSFARAQQKEDQLGSSLARSNQSVRDNESYSTLDELEHRIEHLGTMTRSRNELKRREALWDLFQSECMFLYDHLLVLKNVFMEPLKKIQVEGFAMFAEPEVLFGNLDELCCVTYAFCKEFLSLLIQKISADEVNATDVLVKLFQKSSKAHALTQAYHRYTLNYINALNYLETLRRQVEFNEFEKWCSRDSRCKKLQLTDLLVSPVQHIMRVPLILKEIEMRTEDSSEKKIILSIIESEENSLRELDDKMKWLKNFERLLEIQRSIVWPSINELDPKAFIPDFLKASLSKQPCERLIVSPRRQIVLEGSLQLLDTGKPSEAFVLLFDDMLLITRRKKALHKKKSSLTENWASTCSNKSPLPNEPPYKYIVYKQPLSLDRFFIHDVSVQDGAVNNLKNAFALVCLNRFQQVVTVHTFQASTEAIKVLWLSKLHDTIDRWKRTLQNTVFRNQRAAAHAGVTTFPTDGATPTLK